MPWWRGAKNPKIAILAALVVFIVAAEVFREVFFDHYSTERVCTFESIGDFPGSDYVDQFSAAHDIADDASKVVGHGTQNSLPGNSNPVEYRVAATWSGMPPTLTSLGYAEPPYGSLVESVAMGISGDGTRIVGKATYNAVEQPVYWLAGKINRLPYVSDSLISGSAIDASSDAGMIVGYGSSWVDAKYYGAPRRAYLWKRGGLNYTAYELPTYIAGRASNSSYASAVSSLGETIGGAVFDSIAGRGVSVWPVIWRQAPSGGSSFELVPLAGTVGEDAVGEVLDISEDGRIAVGSLGTYPNAKPCWWWVASPSAPPISAHAIPLPAGDFSGIATCTNRTGTAIFGARMAEPSPGDTVFNGFMFDGVGMTTADLRQYLDSPPGAIPAGFDLGQIMGTAADEQGYVGAGFNGTWSEGWVVRCKTVYHPWWRHVIHYVFGPPKPSSAKPPH